MQKVIIFAAPSGSGKTSIVKELLNSDNKLMFSVSATTRGIRKTEKDGVDYHFLSIESFRDKIDNNEFVEYQEVYENLYYGTLKSELDKIWEKEGVVIFDVDVIGGINLKKIFGNNALSIFIKAPSVEELRKRLISRSTDTSESINTRLQKAESEIKYESEYDCILINDDFQKSINQAKKMVSDFICQK